MIPRRRHNFNNKVIQRTTSETIRIGEPNVINRPINLSPLSQGTNNQTNHTNARKPPPAPGSSSASFVVTGVVSTRTDAATTASTCNSPDDSEEFSRQTDIETPSVSEDTSYSLYTEDVDYCACEEIILKRCVNAVMSSTDDLLAQRACIQAINHSKPSSPIQIIASNVPAAAAENAAQRESSHIPSPGRFIGRFQVVKVESIHPFRRGRWICHDYVDNSEYAPKDGYEFFAGKFIKRNELIEVKKKMLDADSDNFFFDSLREQGLRAIDQSSVTLVHDSRTPLVFMNAPILSSSYHPILRTDNTADAYNTTKLGVLTNPSSKTATSSLIRNVPMTARAQ